MPIKDIFNSTAKAPGRLKESLSNLFGPVKYVAAKETPPVSYSLADRGVSLSDADFDAARPLIFGEVSNRTPDKQALEANVILNTALNRVKEYNARGQKKTLTDVFAMPNQYQAYKGKQYQEYFNPSDPVALAKKKQIDSILDEIKKQIQAGKYVDNTEGAYYYVHQPTGEITYDSKRPLFAK